MSRGKVWHRRRDLKPCRCGTGLMYMNCCKGRYENHQRGRVRLRRTRRQFDGLRAQGLAHTAMGLHLGALVGALASAVWAGLHRRAVDRRRKVRR